MNIPLAALVTIIYIGITIYLSWLGFKKTRSAADYLIAGRKVHPFLLAMGYGATFISTSAIVGFGGVAGFMGMGLLWLTFLNIFVGIFISFVIFGKRTRAIGRHLGAHTFPELLGRRFQSKWIQIIAGAIIFLTMPLYASAVMIGVVRFIEQTFHLNYDIALLGFAFIIMGYVFFGGLKGVLYADAFQGSIMLLGMIFLLIFTYYHLGGITEAHAGLTELKAQLPQKFIDMGHTGWTSMPKFGSQLWWIMVSTIILGVGIGVLAQPQLAVRFMMVNSGREINRAIGVGGFFILMTVGVTFVIGSLSNLYFFKHFDKIAMQMAIDPATQKPNIDTIIPIFLNESMPQWFTYVFLLILLAAGMSTISSLFHAIGTAFGRDIFQQVFKQATHEKTIVITRIGIFIAFLITIFLAYILPGSIIAIATALFFGLCAATFLPAYCGAIFSRHITRNIAYLSMGCGFSTWLLWILFIHIKESSALGLCNLLFNKPSLVAGSVIAFVDPIVIALPVSTAVALIGTLIQRSKNNISA